MTHTDKDVDIAATLRGQMADHGISVKEMAARIGSPYRTLQDQLLGKSKLPASVYIRLIKELHPNFPVEVAVELDEEALAIGLEDALIGPLLPVLSAQGPGRTSIDPPPNPDVRTDEMRLADAKRLAFFVAFGYHAARKSGKRRGG